MSLVSVFLGVAFYLTAICWKTTATTWTLLVAFLVSLLSLKDTIPTSYSVLAIIVLLVIAAAFSLLRVSKEQNAKIKEHDATIRNADLHDSHRNDLKELS